VDETRGGGRRGTCLFTVDDVEFAILLGEDVAGAVPAVGGEGVLVGLGVVVVALSDDGALDECLAGLTAGHVFAVIVDEAGSRCK
jgi:hypothetical protein